MVVDKARERLKQDFVLKSKQREGIWHVHNRSEVLQQAMASQCATKLCLSCWSGRSLRVW